MTGITRRAALAVVLATPALAQPGVAQGEWPARPVKVLVPFPPGGAADVPARLLNEHLGRVLGVPFVIDNRPGGNTVIAADAAAKSAPDGYTFLFCSNSTMASVPLLVANAPYQPERDFATVGLVSRAPFFVVVPAASPANSLAELLELARRQPGKLSYGSNGNGTSGNLGMELLKLTQRLDIVHVPYRSYVQALTDMLGGRLDLMLADLTVVGSAVQAGAVKALAAAVPARSSFFPALPTVAEVTGIEGFDAGVWFGLFAPTGVPEAVVRRLNAEVVAWLGRPETVEALRRIGQVPDAGSPEALRATVRADGARYARIIRETGVRID